MDARQYWTERLTQATIEELVGFMKFPMNDQFAELARQELERRKEERCNLHGTTA